jgi:hypothetical protein
MRAEAAPSRARLKRRQPRPAWTWVLPFMSVMAAFGIPLLMWYAWDAIANSTDGEVTAAVTDPNAPGYQVIVNPSPSHMVLTLDATGDLAMVTVLSLGPNDIGGNILHIAPETLVEDSANYERVIDAYRDKGPARTRRVVASLLDVNVDEMTVLDEQRWAQLVGPAGAIPVDISEDLVRVNNLGDTEIVYGIGNVAVQPSEIANFLGWVNPGSHPGTRLDRHESFWRAWLALITASNDPGIVPGEVDSGTGRFIRGLANGDAITVHYVTTPASLADSVPATEVEVEELRTIIGQMIPFPLPATQGARPEVRLLDGVGSVNLAGLYAPALVGAGAQVVVLGNTQAFGVEETEVVYHDSIWEDDAFAFAQVLGGANVTFEPMTDVLFDVTVIIGQDLAGVD